MLTTSNGSHTRNQPASWTDVLQPHPAALLLPRMASKASWKLGEDIKERGLQTPVVVLIDANGKRWLIDGISRLDAMQEVGLEAVKNGALNPDVVHFQEISSVDPVDYVLSANVHRRHLSSKGKRELAANLLEKYPEKTDRQIAELVGISHPTVAAVRTELERRGKIFHAETRTDMQGRRQPARKRREASPPMPAASAAPIVSTSVPAAPVDAFSDKPTAIEPPIVSIEQPATKQPELPKSTPDVPAGPNMSATTVEPTLRAAPVEPDVLARFWTLIEAIDKVQELGRQVVAGPKINSLTQSCRKKINSGLRDLAKILRTLREEVAKPVKTADIKPAGAKSIKISSDVDAALKNWRARSICECEDLLLAVRRAAGTGLHLSQSQWRTVQEIKDEIAARNKAAATIMAANAA